VIVPVFSLLTMSKPFLTLAEYEALVTERKTLMRLQFLCWPALSPSLQSKKFRKKVEAALLDSLTPTDAATPSCGYRYDGVGVAGPKADEVRCWLDHSTVEGCVIEGAPKVCRVDYYMCEDGSSFIKVVPLEVLSGLSKSRGRARGPATPQRPSAPPVRSTRKRQTPKEKDASQD
jgi:hypothetical protein